MNAENEKGTCQGASLTDLNLESTDVGIVTSSGAQVEPVVNSGFEGPFLVPTVDFVFPDDNPELVKAENVFTTCLLRLLEEQDTALAAACVYVFRIDLRKTEEIISSYDISPATFFRKKEKVQTLIHKIVREENL